MKGLTVAGLVLSLAIAFGGIAGADPLANGEVSVTAVVAEYAELRFVTPEELLNQRIEFVGRAHEEQSITPVKFMVVANTDVKVSIEHSSGLPRFDGEEVLWMETRVVTDTGNVYGSTGKGRGTIRGAFSQGPGSMGYTLSATARLGEVHEQPAGEYGVTWTLTVTAAD